VNGDKTSSVAWTTLVSPVSWLVRQYGWSELDMLQRVIREKMDQQQCWSIDWWERE
jgi:hypothetical protein